MNKWQLYKLLRKQDNLRNERHPMFEKNRFMKFLGWFMFLYYAAILILMGVVMPAGLSGEYNGVAAFHVIDGFFLWVLFVDFWIRFTVQETPAQTVKPYRLLPISRKFLMHVYLTRSGFSSGNMFWWFFLVPFGLLAVMPLLGWWSFVGWLLGWWMLCIANGFFYLFVRALCMRHLAWVLLPVLVHGGLILLMLLPEKNCLDMPCTEFMYQFALGNPLAFLAGAALIGVGYYANFVLQSGMSYNEVAKKEEIKHASKMSFLNRYGAMGEYLKLEIKLRLRNKQVRTGFFVMLGMMVFFSAMLYFTDIYDGTFMKSFILLYNYVGLGTMTLVGIMCYEGNYIDGLMSRRESIFELLRAKFYFNSALMLIPLVLVFPLTYIGKISVWMNIAYFLFTIGIIYPGVFQLAVYNNNTLPLNQKLTGKQGNATQQIVAMVVLFLPIGLERLSVWLMGPVWGYAPMMALGLAGICTHKIWLRNIYKRFMNRRYVNMEGFRASRNS